MNKILKVHPADDIIVALTDLQKGEELKLEGQHFKLLYDVPAKHKFAAKDFKKEDKIHMYGLTVGTASIEILKGEVITTKNIKHSASEYQQRKARKNWIPPKIVKWQDRTFMGFHRSDGKIGTANYWLAFPLVFCENRNIEILREAVNSQLSPEVDTTYRQKAKELLGMAIEGKPPHEILSKQWKPTNNTLETKKYFPNVDGVKFITHESGCGGTRQDAASLCQLIAGYVNHPNVAGATVLSLGCQNAEISMLWEKIKNINPRFDKPVEIFDQQECGSEQLMLESALKHIFSGLVIANQYTRSKAPLSKLVIGLECGGSDGFSGISANPSMGHTSDLIVALGGAAILSEFPELCGVEQELIDRCLHEEDAQKFLSLMQDYAKKAEQAGSGFDANPSPGNIKDGLLTDAMKSAGAAKKGGTSPVVQVLDYTEQVSQPGLHLLCTPGNDVESTTGLGGSGANIILFSTGLGTPTGNPVVPVIKISSNNTLAARMKDIIDFNTGKIITGEQTIEEVGEELLNFIIDVASGTIRTKAQEKNQDDFIPWKRGVSL